MARAQQLALAAFDPAEQQVVSLAKRQPPSTGRIQAGPEKRGAWPEQTDKVQQRVHTVWTKRNFFRSIDYIPSVLAGL
jgi:hypothetical protein